MSVKAKQRVGPFLLDRQIARGAYGLVCRAHHAGSDTPVALKMLTSAAAQKPGVASALRREVESMAKLHHPGIAAVLDTGVVEDALELDGGRLPSGTPWIAMEFVGGYPSSSQEGRMSWPVLQRFLYDLLDALAHAHAQGILHRDIKPENIMVVPDGDQLLPKLVDFGIARALDEDDKNATMRPGEDKIVGTPKYMAPEQIMGFWRDEGPQTDLYSLGCVAWKFVTGSAPFCGEDSIDTLNQHVHGDLPPFEPMIQVPPGLELWLGTLLTKHPRQRPGRAAEAARTLMELPQDADAPASGSGHAVGTRVDSEDPMPTGKPASTDEPAAPASVTDLAQAELRGGSGTTGDALHVLPASWEALTPPRPPVKLAGAGLSLYGLRTIPVVGRRRERDALWRELKDATDTGERRTVWISGEPGAGKSRLARWISHRAHAAGGFEVLQAVHGADGGSPRDGLGSMLRQHFGCAGQSRAEMQSRLEMIFDAHGWTDRVAQFDRGVYLEMMAPVELEQDGPAGNAPAHSVRERHLALDRLFERITEQRPLVLWLDDAASSSETLRLIAFLANRTRFNPLPMLTLVTTRTTDLGSKGVRQAFEECRDFGNMRHLELSRLGEDHMYELVTRLLGLEEDLARRVVERADGRPLFAVQIVDGWVDRDELVVGEQGFRLHASADVRLPDDIHQMWLERLERKLSSLSTDEAERQSAWRAMETAAILGSEVATREWLACCGEAGISIPGKLIGVLAARNLVARADGGWTFVHALLRESLIRHAEERGYAATHHACCARGLDNLYGSKSPQLAFRRARHLAAANQLYEALELAERAAVDFRDRGEPERGAEACEFHAEIIERLNPPEPSRARTAQWRLRSHLLRARGELEESKRLAERALEVARAEGYEELYAQALQTNGVVMISLGELVAGAEMLEEATRRARELDMMDLVAVSYRNAGIARHYNGQTDLARDHLQAALDAYRATGNRSGQATVRAVRASIGKSEETVYESIEQTREALDIAREVGDRHAIGHISNSLAELYRFAGELRLAARYYEDAHAHCKACGSNDQHVILVNLMLVELARGEFDRVLQLSKPLLEMARTHDWEFSSFVLLGDAIGRVVQDDYPLARAHTTEAIQKAVHADPDHLILTEHLIEQLEERGWEDILDDVRAFEASQRALMSDSDDPTA